MQYYTPDKSVNSSLPVGLLTREVLTFHYGISFPCQPGESDKLFLHQCWHRALAVSLVEVSALRLPNMPGGIAHEAFKEDTGLLRQV